MKGSRAVRVVLILCAIGLAIWFTVIRKPGILHARAEQAHRGSERSSTPLPPGSGLTGQQNAIEKGSPDADSGQAQPGHNIADLPSGVAPGLNGMDTASLGIRSLPVAENRPYRNPAICAKDRPDTLSPPGWHVTMTLHNPDGWEFAPAAASVATDEVWNGSQSVRVQNVQIANVILWQAIDARPFQNQRVEFSAMVKLAPVPGNGISIFAVARTEESLVLPAAGATGVELDQSRLPWRRYSAVIDIPRGSDVLVYGLQSMSDAWIDDTQVSVVDNLNVSRFAPHQRAASDRMTMPIPPEFILPKPANLDFELAGIPIAESAAKESARCKTGQP